MYTVDEREDIKNRLISLFRRLPGIAGVILVGSGAEGFKDEYSDVDFCIVTEAPVEALLEIMKKCSAAIHSEFPVMKFQEMPERQLQIYFLQSFLEIDIGYVELSKLEAVRKRWKVCFDHTGQLDRIMQESWDRIRKYHGKKTNVDVDQIYRDYYNTIWHSIQHAVTSIKRGQLWRSSYEINYIRDAAIELRGYKLSLETKCFRSVDEFDDVFLRKLSKCHIGEMREKELFRALYEAVVLFFDEIAEVAVEYAFYDIDEYREAMQSYIVNYGDKSANSTIKYPEVKNE